MGKFPCPSVTRTPTLEIEVITDWLLMVGRLKNKKQERKKERKHDTTADAKRFSSKFDYETGLNYMWIYTGGENQREERK